MKHAAELDLLAYEDPVFYDRLERARVQATDRLGMIQSIGRLIQQVMTTIAFSVSIVLFSPWLLLLLVAGVVPAFLGESHFAFLGYAKNFRQTPVRRQLDYLRVLGGSKEAAKELKLFGLKDFLTAASPSFPTRFTRKTCLSPARKLIAGALLSLIGTMGYYGAYVYVIWRTVSWCDDHRILDVPFGRDHAGEFEHPADFLNTFEHRRPSPVPYRSRGLSSRCSPRFAPSRRAAYSAAHPTGLRVPQCLFPISRRIAQCSRPFQFPSASGRAGRAHRRKRSGQNHHRQAADATLRSDRRTDPARRDRPSRI